MRTAQNGKGSKPRKTTSEERANFNSSKLWKDDDNKELRDDYDVSLGWCDRCNFPCFGGYKVDSQVICTDCIERL